MEYKSSFMGVTVMTNINLSNSKIIDITNSLESKPLKPSSHLYKRYLEKTIGEAADNFSKMYSNEAKEKSGLVLLSVILAAHRNYTKQVEPQIERVRKMDFRSFGDLKKETIDFETFVKFVGMNDFEKYTIIVELLKTIDVLKIRTGIKDDYEVMNKWAIGSNHFDFDKNPIGKIKGIGIATFQHLRMNFGADTVKPDQRVKEVLTKEYNLLLKNDLECITAVEYIAKVTGKKVIYIDQVLVNYGSGYYVSNPSSQENKTPKQEVNKTTNIKSSISIAKNKPMGNGTSDQMIRYILDAVEQLDVVIEKRNDGGYIVVANKLKHLSRGKNIVTYWPTASSVALIILGLIPNRTTFYTVNDMKNMNVAERIVEKYNLMTNK